MASIQKPDKNIFFSKKLVSYAALLSGSIICLLIAHFNFNKFYWLFIVGLLGFSFTTACLVVTMLEQFLPSGLVNHSLWTGEGVGGKGLAGLITGILAIAFMVGIPFMLMKMGVDYIK